MGTIINVAAILLGGVLGLLFGSRLPERIRQTVIAGLGLFVLAIGLQMSLGSKQPLVVLGALLVGGILGEALRIEDRLRSLGDWLERHFDGGSSAANTSEEDSPRYSSRFIRGFLTSSLVFSIGPMAILGSIQDGLYGDYKLLAVKSVLDGFGSLAFASTLGVGVLFSSLITLVYQGGVSLTASLAKTFISDAMMNEMTATGGLLLIGIAISGLLEIKPIRVGNFLPALAIAPLIVAILAALGISLN